MNTEIKLNKLQAELGITNVQLLTVLTAIKENRLFIRPGTMSSELAVRHDNGKVIFCTVGRLAPERIKELAGLPEKGVNNHEK